MKLVLLSLLAALPLAAADDMEQILLPIEPSVVMCAHNSRFETRLVVYNENGHAVRPACADDECGEIAPGGREVTPVSSVPAPSFLFLPKSEVEKLRMALVVESIERDHPDDRSFAELPIVNVKDFRDTTLSFVGARLEPGFRQALRLYALDGTRQSEVLVVAYDLATNVPLYWHIHTLTPLSGETNDSGQSLRPAFNMECDLSRELPQMLDGRNVRVEIEPLTEGMKFWAFMSITNNKTQQFHTITPR